MSTHPELQRWKVVCAYDGTSFGGWQSQPDGNSVQDAIERRLAEIFKETIRIHGSGRTDAGVHARGQCFHFDANWRHAPDRLHAALRVGLPGAIQIRSVRKARGDFHARFAAKGKIYVYHLYLGDPDPFSRPHVWAVERPQPLDLDAMRAAAAILRGRHDFAAFSAFNGSESGDTVRDLTRLDIVRRGRRIRLVFSADGFLYKMVRSLAGALVAVGEGRMTVGRVTELLEGGKRLAEVETAPPQGLFLERVIY